MPAYIVAAQAAQSTASHTEARQLLDRAQELAATLPECDERDLTELMIRAQRTISSSSLYGYGYPDVFEDFTVAEEICRKLTNRPEIMPAQVGIWSYLLVRGSVDAASVVLEPLTDVLDDPATAWFAPEIKSCMGYGAFYQGRLDEAHRWLVEAWEGYGARSTDAASSPFWPLPHDAVPITAVALACVAALQGATEESALWERRALATAEELDFPAGPFSAAFVSVYLAWIRMITGNRGRGTRVRTTHDRDRRTVPLRLFPAARHPVRPDARARQSLRGGSSSSSTHWVWTSSGTGRSARRISASSPRTTTISATPTRHCEALDEALERSVSSGELVHQPDLLRLRAEIMAAAHPERMAEAVKDLDAAVEIGLAQGSLVLALRAANDLARLPHDRPPDWGDRIRGRARAVPAQFLEPRIRPGARPPGALTWRRPGGRWPFSAAAWARWPRRSSSAKGTGPDRFERITVYQRGWRLGGKGASSRGAHGRIEEHGLHVLLGYYDQTFDVMRRCYEALDRPQADPACPIRTWDDAVAPSNLVGVVDRARRHVGTMGGVVQPGRRSSRFAERTSGRHRDGRLAASPWPTSSSGRSAS